MAKFRFEVPANVTLPWVPGGIPVPLRNAIQGWMDGNPRQFGTETFTPGNRNPLYHDLVTDPVAVGGAKWHRRGDIAVCEVEEGWLADDILELIVLLGGEVEDLTLFIEITNPDRPIPGGLPGGNGNARWRDFFDTHPLRQIGSKWYVAAVRNRRGDPIRYSELRRVNDNNIRVLRVSEMKQIIADNQEDLEAQQ